MMRKTCPCFQVLVKKAFINNYKNTVIVQSSLGVCGRLIPGSIPPHTKFLQCSSLIKQCGFANNLYICSHMLSVTSGLLIIPIQSKCDTHSHYTILGFYLHYFCCIIFHLKKIFFKYF